MKDSISFSKKLKFWQINWPAGQRAQVRGRGRSKINRTKNRGTNESILKKNIHILSRIISSFRNRNFKGINEKVQKRNWHTHRPKSEVMSSWPSLKIMFET